MGQLTNPFGTAMKEIFAKLENNQELKTQRDSLVGQNLSMDQVLQIGQAIEQEMNSRKQGIIEVFQTTLNQMAIEVVENEVQTEKMIYNAAYLIPWEKEPEFGEKVEAIDDQFKGKFTIRYNSFTAPFNFAQIEQQN